MRQSILFKRPCFSVFIGENNAVYRHAVSFNMNAITEKHKDFSLVSRREEKLIEKYYESNDFNLIKENYKNLKNFDILQGRIKIIEEYQNLFNESATQILDKFESIYDLGFVNFYRNNKEYIEYLVDKYNEFNTDVWNRGISAIDSFFGTYCYGKGKQKEPIFCVYLKETFNLTNNKEKIDLYEFENRYFNFINGFVITNSPVMMNSCFKNNSNSLTSCFILSLGNKYSDYMLLLSRITNMNLSKGGVCINLSKVRSFSDEFDNNIMGVGPVRVTLGIEEHMKMVTSSSVKRRTAIGVSLDCWHYEYENFIALQRELGNINKQKVTLCNISTLVCDLFYERVVQDKEWTMFCPSVVPKLIDANSENFKQIYEEYENSLDPLIISRRHSTSARSIQKGISLSCRSSGKPYQNSTDTIDMCNNLKSLGRAFPNVCNEVLLRTTNNITSKSSLTSVCNISHVSYRHAAIGSYSDNADLWEVKEKLTHNISFDMLADKIRRTVRECYSIVQFAKFNISEFDNEEIFNLANNEDRPISIGMSGLSDLYCMINIAHGTEQMKFIDEALFANHYFNARAEGVIIAKQNGKPHSSWKYSDAAKGLHQYDLAFLRKDQMLKKHQWLNNFSYKQTSKREPMNPAVWNQKVIVYEDLVIEPSWESLKLAEKKYGNAFGYITGFQPTATTSICVNNSESCEFIDTNFKTRQVTSGEYYIINKSLCNDLDEIGLFEQYVKDILKKNIGLMKNFCNEVVEESEKRNIYIHEDTKNKLLWIEKKYSTMNEIHYKDILDVYEIRYLYTDMGISHNLYIYEDETKKTIEENTNNLNKWLKYHGELTIMCWLKGLKNISYYTRTIVKNTDNSSSLKYDTNQCTTSCS